MLLLQYKIRYFGSQSISFNWSSCSSLETSEWKLSQKRFTHLWFDEQKETPRKESDIRSSVEQLSLKKTYLIHLK